MGGNDDPYAQVSRGKLQIKGEHGVKKKKKKNKEKKLLEQVKVTAKEEKTDQNPDTSELNHTESKKTKAELTFLKMKEKTQMQRILDKASMTHKQRVEKFNQHLDSLTEHFDIPKVSWTK